MSALERIAYFQGRRDEGPNQELARELAHARDAIGIEEIAANLTNPDSNIGSDCLKVLYEIGYIDPQLIASYYASFLDLLKSRNNRLVWGGMIALSTIADRFPREIGLRMDEIQSAIEKGSVITIDNGIKVLATLAAHNPDQAAGIFSYLLEHLASCRSKDVPQHAEKTLAAVNAGNKSVFIAMLKKRIPELTGTQTVRVNKIVREAEKR